MAICMMAKTGGAIMGALADGFAACVGLGNGVGERRVHLDRILARVLVEDVQEYDELAVAPLEP